MTTLYSGLSIGAIYALVAMGYNVVFVASGHFNFAHAQFVMVGTFGAYVSLVTWGLAWALVLPITIVIGLVIGLVEERVAIRPVERLEGSSQLVTTVAFSVILGGAASVIWGTEPRLVPFLGSGRSLTLFGGFIQPVELCIIGLALLCAFGLYLLSSRTMWGLAALAAAEDRGAAALRGINVRRLSLGAFALAGAIGTMVGPFVGPKTYAVFDLGNLLAIKGFLALAIGGFGSLKGTLVGGFAAGLVEAVGSRWLGPSEADLLVFGVLVATLLCMPQGVFGRTNLRVV